MPNAAPKLEWCIARLGEDMNWWIDEISDDINWDVDGLSILDPRQLAHIIDLLDPLRDYDLQSDLFDDAFYKFRIDSKIDSDRLRLVRGSGSILGSEDMVFALPDVVDDERGPYADFIDHVTRLRVKLLNDSIEFEQKLTVEELEDEIRERQNADFMEGRAIHVFNELCDILEYVPDGYELEDDEDKDDSGADEEDIPDLDDDAAEEDERIEEDETMRWDEDEDEEDEDEDRYDSLGDEEDEDEEDDER